MIKSTFPNFIVGTFLMLCPTRAMINDFQEEERLKIPHANLFHQSSPRKETSSLVSAVDFPDDLLLSVFKLLDVEDLGRVAQVSFPWKRVEENPDLWRYIGLKCYGDYLSKEDFREAPRQKAIIHYLSVVVNVTDSLEAIERCVSHYRLDLYVPFLKKYIEINSLNDLVENSSGYDELIAQGNKEAIERKFNCHLEGEYAYMKDLTAARELNELLIEKGDPKAIRRKLESLTLGGVKVWKTVASLGYHSPQYVSVMVPLYGSVLDLTAAREFNNLLFARGDSEAIERKLEGLTEGKYSYEQNLEGAKELINVLIEKGNFKANEKKIEGLTEGKYGYKKDLEAARTFNDLLVDQDDQGAIERKVAGLAEGKYGYEQNLEAAREFNNLLVEKGNSDAIKRKLEGFLRGINGYERDPETARACNDLFVERGDLEANKRKMIGLECGEYGYTRDLVTARKFHDLLVERGNLEAIKKKLSGLMSRYKADPKAAEFIENLISCEFPVPRAIGKYIKAFAMKYGVAKLGYEKDREKAIQFIKKNYVPY